VKADKVQCGIDVVSGQTSSQGAPELALLPAQSTTTTTATATTTSKLQLVIQLQY